jgi:uroporphyrinogen-III synthase
MASAVELLEALGADPVPDPMLAVEPTGTVPGEGFGGPPDYVVFTSKTGGELAAEAGWTPGDATVCAIGAATADALRGAGYPVDIVPAEYSSRGLVAALAEEVEGATVEVARSDHGSPVLLEGLEDAGATVRETVLYELVCPREAGESVALASKGALDAVMFTSSLTVEHFLAVARDHGVLDDVRRGLEDAIVGAIGDPTRETAETAGVEVDVVAEEADVELLATAVVEAAAPGYHG